MHNVFISTPDSPIEAQMRWMFIEDSTSRDKSYYDFLNNLLVSITAK